MKIHRTTKVGRRSLSALFFALCALLGLITLPSVALAKGTIKADKLAIDEVEGSWRFSFTVDNGTMPDIQFIPVLITFEPVTLYERSLTDESGDKPVLTKRQLQNQKTIDVSTDISFGDGTGKIFKSTKFKITLTRDKGFEAGDYVMIVKKSDTMETLGSKVRLILNGENKAVDRRSISFVGEDPNKKKAPPPPPADEPEKKEPANEEPSTPPADSDPPAASEPPPVPPKQGGCGCVLGGNTSEQGALALLGLSVLVAARRRRSLHGSARKAG